MIPLTTMAANVGVSASYLTDMERGARTMAPRVRRAYLQALGYRPPTASLNPSAEGAAVQPSAAPTPQTPPPGNNHPGTTAGEDPSAAPSAEGLNR